MADRLAPLDVSFLSLDQPTTAMQVGNVGSIAAPGQGFDYVTLCELISRRLAFAGASFPLNTAGARMLEAYPVVPLAKGQALSTGLTSYNGGVYYGLDADRDAMPDSDVLAECITESLAELREAGR